MKLFENTDVIKLPNGKEIRYDDHDAVPFLYYEDSLYIGTYSSTHGDIIDEIFTNFQDTFFDRWCQMIEKYDEIWDHIYNNGRIWTKNKIISFWNNPDKNKFIDVVCDLEKELKIKIWNNDYKIEIEKVHYHSKDIEMNHPDYEKFEVPEKEVKEINGDVTFSKFIPIEWYKKKNNSKPKLTLQQRQLMYSEHIITKFKMFENKNEPTIGDYVYCVEKPSIMNTPELLVFLSLNIGQIVDYDDNNVNGGWYIKGDYNQKIYFDNIPNDLAENRANFDKDNCRWFSKDEIKFWANSPEEVQQLIDANKFGL